MAAASSIAPIAITFDALVVLLPDPSALAPGRLASTLGRVAPVCESLADSCSNLTDSELEAVPSVRRALPALLLLAIETAQLSPHVLCIHHNALIILAAVAPAQSNAVNPVQFGRLFDVLVNRETAAEPEAAHAVSQLVQHLADTKAGCELVANQRGAAALLKMLESQPSCLQVLTSCCEACKALATRSSRGDLATITEMLRTITWKAINSLDKVPRGARGNTAWSAACASLVAQFRYDCAGSIRFPLLLGDKQQQSHFFKDMAEAALEAPAAEQSAVLFMLRCLAAILGGKSKWLGARHTHALQVISAMAMLPRYSMLLQSAGLLGRLVVHLQLEPGGLPALCIAVREAMENTVRALADTEAFNALQLSGTLHPDYSEHWPLNERCWQLATALVRLEGQPVLKDDTIVPNIKIAAPVAQVVAPVGASKKVRRTTTKCEAQEAAPALRPQMKFYPPVLVGVRGGGGQLGLPPTVEDRKLAKEQLTECQGCTARARALTETAVRSFLNAETFCSKCARRVVYYQLYSIPKGQRGLLCGDAEKAAGRLVFNARFEGGNLRQVTQVSPNGWHMWLQHDYNSRGHTQWFFFSVAGGAAGQKVEFEILNLEKPGSLFNDGMLPAVHSSCNPAAGWRRTGQKVCYFPSNTIRIGCARRQWVLRMELEFEHASETLHVAMGVPYSTHDLRNDLAAIANEPDRAAVASESKLCHELSGHPVPMLRVTEPGATTDRKVVVISGRVHPGEACSSWQMRGVLQFITGPSAEAANLRSHFIFIIIPMLNPDGVAVGNYRCHCLGACTVGKP